MVNPSISIWSRARPRTSPVPEDSTPRVPWRVVSLPPRVLGSHRDGKEATTDSEIDTVSSCCDSPTRATNIIGRSGACDILNSSSSDFPAIISSVVDDELCSSSDGSSTPKMNLPGSGSSILHEIPRDLATAARTRTEVKMGKHSREWQTSANRSIQVTQPYIEVSCTSSAMNLSCTAAAPLVVDVACGERREWSPRPHLRATRKMPIQSPGAATGRQGSLEAKENSNNQPCTPTLEVRTPKAPPRPTRPRPIWAVLRNRTLNTTRREPSIFRGNIENEVKNGVDAQAVAQTRQQLSWHIFNRRIFGVREVPRRGVVAFPEWVMFSAGVPPSGLSEQSRWALRLGRDRGNVPS